MKKIYYRWKDETCNGVNPEWVEMTGKEFIEFKRNPKNKHRRFVRYVDGYSEAPIIILETTKQKYDEWNREHLDEIYKSKVKKESQRQLVSLDLEIEGTDSDVMSLHDVIADERVDVEHDAIAGCLNAILTEALKHLSAEEFDLVEKMFLSDMPLTERAYAELLGMSSVAVHKRKMKIVEKLKKYF